MEGLHLLPDLFATTGLDGKNGPKRCLPPEPYPPRLSTPPHIPVGRENIQIPMPALWSVSSTQSVHQSTEASGGLPEADQLSLNYISR